MQKNPLTFDQLPTAVYQLSCEVSELRRLLIDQPQETSLPSNNKPVGVNEAADFLGISRQTVYQNIDKIPHKKRFGRLYFFVSELADYVKAGEGRGA
ncbi:helix-turn-helix domain-containing protein [Spirosoma aerophilum]